MRNTTTKHNQNIGIYIARIRAGSKGQGGCSRMGGSEGGRRGCRRGEGADKDQNFKKLRNSGFFCIWCQQEEREGGSWVTALEGTGWGQRMGVC